MVLDVVGSNPTSRPNLSLLFLVTYFNFSPAFCGTNLVQSFWTTARYLQEKDLAFEWSVAFPPATQTGKANPTLIARSVSLFSST